MTAMDASTSSTPRAQPVNPASTRASIRVSADPSVQYLLRIGDTCLIMAQRLAEWCGHAPMLEEDIALSNMALDLVGQARAVLTRAGALEAELGGEAHDEDQLAFLREERDFRNVTLVELPRGDFAATTVRDLAMATFLRLLWQRLERSSDAELAGIAGKAVKEARYHQEHAADWVVRLGDGTDESAARMRAAIDWLWPYTAELFESDAVVGPRPALGRVAGRLVRGDPSGDPGRGSDVARRPTLPQHRQERQAQRASRLHPGRDAASAAIVSGRRVVIDLVAASRVERAWHVLDSVLDPEVPVVSVRDLGIVRDVRESDAGGIVVVVTPTYSGCPATEVIAQSIVDALDAEGLGPVRVEMRRAPAWTTDWMSDAGRRKLRDYGISPPGPVAAAATAPLRFVPRQRLVLLPCPRCESTDTERLAAFGSTACKALWRCKACGEPFEHFKPI